MSIPTSSLGSSGLSAAETKANLKKGVVKANPNAPVRPKKRVRDEIFLVGYPDPERVSDNQIINVDLIEEGVFEHYGNHYRKFRVLKVYPVK